MIHPFRDQGASIEWGERLDGIPGSDSETKSCVFKVKIYSEPFVFKVVRSSVLITTKLILKSSNSSIPYPLCGIGVID
ncbi:hypothetical protein F5B18DRAFT_639289 [Nemania serpens]|nr:hypothetical protein F5B18DRAFT_639289 [Nemania serpens]